MKTDWYVENKKAHFAFTSRESPFPAYAHHHGLFPKPGNPHACTGLHYLMLFHIHLICNISVVNSNFQTAGRSRNIQKDMKDGKERKRLMEGDMKTE